MLGVFNLARPNGRELPEPPWCEAGNRFDSRLGSESTGEGSDSESSAAEWRPKLWSAGLELLSCSVAPFFLFCLVAAH